MTAIRILSFLAICSSFASCHFVKAPVPFGLKPAKLDPDYYNGTWAGEDGDTCEIEVIDGDGGILQMTYRDGGAEDAPEFRKIKVHMLVGKKWQYASVPAAGDGSNSDGFMFGCIQATRKRIIIWMPQVAKFEQLINDGKIKGIVIKKDVILDKITPELIDVIESENNGFVFDWREPLILLKQENDK